METSNKKVKLIPGWLNGRGMYGNKYDVLEVWKERLEPDCEIEAEYVIGHSLGAKWVLLHWISDKSKKIILVNPPLSKKHSWRWFINWIKFLLKEKKPKNKEIVKGWKQKIFGYRKLFSYLLKDFSEIIKSIPKQNIVIIRGTDDYYFCDIKAKEFLEKNSVRIIEVNAGHDWNENIDNAIAKLL